MTLSWHWANQSLPYPNNARVRSRRLRIRTPDLPAWEMDALLNRPSGEILKILYISSILYQSWRMKWCQISLNLQLWPLWNHSTHQFELYQLMSIGYNGNWPSLLHTLFLTFHSWPSDASWRWGHHIPPSHQISYHYVRPNGLKLCANFLNVVQTSWTGYKPLGWAGTARIWTCSKSSGGNPILSRFGRLWWKLVWCEGGIR